jgi:hypothetical protein
MPGGPGINTSRLEANQKKRKKAEDLVTVRDNYADGQDAMKEIFERKRNRGAQHKENKMADYRERFALTFDECEQYGFADAEYRNKIASGEMKGGFAGPDKSFPIASPEDVHNAWMSAGRGKQDPKTTQRKILTIAKKNGWESGLPKAVRDRIKKGGSGMPES